MLTLRSALAALAILCASAALAHDMQGHLTSGGYLLGKQIGASAPGSTKAHGEIINCCLLGGRGDCREVTARELATVEGGFMYAGRFISEDDATLSPDGKRYVCEIHGRPPHCAFYIRPLS